MTKSNPKLQLQTLKEVAVCSQYASINARLNSKTQNEIYTSNVTDLNNPPNCVILNTGVDPIGMNPSSLHQAKKLDKYRRIVSI